MPLVDLKQTTPAPASTALVEETREEYPYGLRIFLDEDTARKLGVAIGPNGPQVGATLRLDAIVRVTELVQREGIQGGAKGSMDLQIEKAQLSPEAQPATAQGMYPSLL